MSVAVAEKLYTPEEFLNLEDSIAYELEDGHLVEREMSAKASSVASRLHFQLEGHLEKYDQGWVFNSEVTYQCFPHRAGRIRRPDVSFVEYGRFEDDELPEGHLQIAPDLAAEIVSPNDTVYDVDRKVQEYLSAGVRLVWVINPETRTVMVHRQGGGGEKRNEDGELNGEDILPNFHCKVRDIMPRKAKPRKTSRKKM